MKIFFTIPNPQGSNPPEKLLFTDKYAEIHKGDTVQHKGNNYRINQLSWIDRKKGELKAICEEVLIPIDVES